MIMDKILFSNVVCWYDIDQLLAEQKELRCKFLRVGYAHSFGRMCARALTLGVHASSASHLIKDEAQINDSRLQQLICLLGCYGC